MNILNSDGSFSNAKSKYPTASGAKLGPGACLVCMVLKRFGFRCPPSHKGEPHPEKPPLPKVVRAFIEKNSPKTQMDDLTKGSLPDFRGIGR